MIANGFIRDLKGKWYNLDEFQYLNIEPSIDGKEYHVYCAFFDKLFVTMEGVYIYTCDTKEEAQRYLDDMMTVRASRIRD